jgi:hypothetical protein
MTRSGSSWFRSAKVAQWWPVMAVTRYSVPMRMASGSTAPMPASSTRSRSPGRNCTAPAQPSPTWLSSANRFARLDVEVAAPALQHTLVAGSRPRQKARTSGPSWLVVDNGIDRDSGIAPGDWR